MYQIGVDIGGTNIKIGLVDDSLEILEQTSIPFPHEGAQTVADRLAEAVRGVLSAAGITEAQLQSIGVVIPGSIDPTGEVVINAYNLGFHDVPFKKLIAAHFPNTPVFMANDANGAALAELYKGAFVGCRTAVLLTLGTGLGGGIILNGKMFNGGMNQGTELGHAYLVDGGEHCTCGRDGCWEAYASATALIRQGKRAGEQHPESALHGREELTALDVFQAADAGDAAAQAVIDRWCVYVAAGLTDLVNSLAPEMILLGGGISRQGERILAPIRAYVTEHCFGGREGAIPVIAAAQLGNEAGIIGAAAL